MTQFYQTGHCLAVCVALLASGPAAAIAGQLPPEITVDRYLLRAERLRSEKDYTAALEEMNKILALQGEHDLTLSEEFHFKYARVLLSVGSIEAAMNTVNQYLAVAGRDGAFYREALGLLDQAEQQLSNLSRISVDTCAGQPRGAACWMVVDNKPECYVWERYLLTDKTVTWTGECSTGFAHGEGTLTRWETGETEIVNTGRLQDGKAHGHWVERNNGGESEGPYVDGKRHGQWVVRDSGGIESEGSYKNGQRDGLWVERHDFLGIVDKGSYENGKKHGLWVEHVITDESCCGLQEETTSRTYVDGELHGNWSFQRSVNGKVRETVKGSFKNGKRHGHWVERGNYGDEFDDDDWWLYEGPYVDGERHGLWSIDKAYEREKKVNYLNGKQVN